MLHTGSVQEMHGIKLQCFASRLPFSHGDGLMTPYSVKKLTPAQHAPTQSPPKSLYPKFVRA